MRWISMHLPGVLLGAVTVMVVALPQTAIGAEPQYDVCAPQVVADVKRRFGHDAVRIEWAWDDGSSDEPESSVQRGSAVVYVEQCDGYYWYEVFANESICEHLPHYGEVQDYIFFRSVNGAC